MSRALPAEMPHMHKHKKHVLASMIAGTLGMVWSGAHAAPIDATTVPLSSLQSLLHGNTQGGVSSINAQKDESQAEVFTFKSSSASAIYVSTASYPVGALQFGLYDIYRPTETLLLFDSNSAALDSAPGDGVSIVVRRYPKSGEAFVLSYESTPGASSFPVHGSAVFSSPVFGFFLTSAYGTWYSQSALNAPGADVNGDGVSDSDYFLAYRGEGDAVDAFGNGVFHSDSGHWYIAAEAGGWAPSDFADFVVQLKSVQQVPEPSALALFGTALLGLALVSRRRRHVKATNTHRFT